MCYIGASVFTSDTVERSFWPSFTFTLASCCSGQPWSLESSTPNTYTWQTQNTCRGMKSCCSYRRAVTQWQHLCGTKVHCRLHSNRARTTQTGSINVSSIETPTQQDVKSKLTSALLTVSRYKTNISVYPPDYLLIHPPGLDDIEYSPQMWLENFIWTTLKGSFLNIIYIKYIFFLNIQPNIVLS